MNTEELPQQPTAKEALEIVALSIKTVDVSSELEEIFRSIISASIAGMRYYTYFPKDCMSTQKSYAIRRTLKEKGYSIDDTPGMGSGISINW